MNSIVLTSYSLPLIRDIGYMEDLTGIQRHPDRKMKDIHVFVFVKEGKIQVFEDGEEYQLEAGSYLFLRKNIEHWGKHPYSPGTKWYYIHFYDSPINQTGEGEKEYGYYPNASLIYEDTYMTKLTLPKRGNVLNTEYTAAKLKQLVLLYESPQPLRPLQLSLQTFQFFIELYSSHLDENRKSKKHFIVNQMIELLRSSPTDKISGEEIAHSLGMNYSYLSTLFREQTGKSVNRFQNELMIEVAIEMFKKNEGNVSEVSDSLGFSNPFYFSRVFKKITGVSPTNYLNNYRYHY